MRNPGIFGFTIWCDVAKFTRQLKRFFILNSPVWQVGLCPGEKVVWRKTALRRHLRALVMINTHYPHLRFLSSLFHTRHEDNGTRGQRRLRCVTTGYRVKVNTGRHDDLRFSRYRCFDHSRHRSLESDAQDDQLPPRDPEDVLGGTWTPGLDIWYFRYFWC